MIRKLLTIAACSATLFAAQASAATVAIFGNSMNLQGSATVVGTDLQMNLNGGEVSSAWLVNPISSAGNFSASFRYSLARTTFDPQADGIAFVLQGIGNTAIGTGGGGIGYLNLGGAAVGSVIHTWDNNRLGLDTTGNPFNAPAAPANLGAAALVSGTETISYDATTHLLSLTGTLDVDGTPYAIGQSVTVDLSTLLGANIYAGFTGATGLSYADQRITDFSIRTDTAVSEPGPLALLALGMGLLGLARRRRQLR
jgi:hypothetical protein